MIYKVTANLKLQKLDFLKSKLTDDIAVPDCIRYKVSGNPLRSRNSLKMYSSQSENAIV